LEVYDGDGCSILHLAMKYKQPEIVILKLIDLFPKRQLEELDNEDRKNMLVMANGLQSQAVLLNLNQMFCNKRMKT